MATHKYTVGDRVLIEPGPHDSNVRRGVYTIVTKLPEAGRGVQYRAKHDQDAHERVLDEAQVRQI